MKHLGPALLVCSVVAVLGCRPSAASFNSPEVQKHLALTTMIGREIHRRDRLTWWSGQLARATLSPEAVEGWVVDVDNPGTDVLFFSEVDGELRVGFIVHCEGTGSESCSAETPSPPVPLSERNLAQFRAVTTAWAHPEFEQTSEHYTHVVIPAGEGPDVDWWVYLIALNPDPNLVVLGQHYRFVVDADGQTVRSFRRFAEGPTVIDVRPIGMPEGVRPVAITVSHPLDDVPTEMHVWAAINYGLDIVVATEPESRRDGPPVLWTVDSTGNIAPLE